MQVSGAFVECHRGYLLKEMIALQATFPEEAQWIADSGSLLLDPVNGKYLSFQAWDAAMIISTPHVFGLTRELAFMRMSWTTSLFVRTAQNRFFTQRTASSCRWPSRRN